MNSLCIARSPVSYIVHDIRRREEGRSASTTLAPLVEESASNVVAAPLAPKQPMMDENYDRLGQIILDARPGWEAMQAASARAGGDGLDQAETDNRNTDKSSMADDQAAEDAAEATAVPEEPSGNDGPVANAE